MIYRMDSVEYMLFTREEPIEALVHTYYASIGTDVRTSGRLHPNVFNWSFLRPSTQVRLLMDDDIDEYRSEYYNEIEQDLDMRIAPVLYEIIKNNERLIILYSQAEKNLMYPSMFAKRIEDRYKLSIYKYKESETDRPYDVTAALHELKKRSKKAYIRKLIYSTPRSLSRNEVNYILKLYGVKPAEEMEERYHQIMEIKRKEIQAIRIGKDIV